MKKRKLSIFMAAILAMSFLAGCGGAETEPTKEVTVVPTEAATAETSEGFTDKRANKDVLTTYEYVTDEMYANADCFNAGDTSRIIAAIQKAERGEKVTIGVIGGSITQGTAASPQNEKCYAAWFKKWWELSFPDTEIEFINAGIGATTSYLGVHRADRDLLDYNPDMVIVEFSVNDQDGLFYKQSYEGLCRKILTKENNPALLLLFMCQDTGLNAIGSHGNIGFRYELPMLNYGNCVMTEIEGGRLTWKEISPDNIHPNNKGHQIVGEIIWRYMNKMYELAQTETVTVAEFTKAPATKDCYKEAQILSNEDIEPVEYGSFEKCETVSAIPHNWKTTGGDEPLVFEVEATNIGIAYYCMTKNGGIYSVYVDGEHVAELNADFSGGWGDYTETKSVYTGDEKKLHRIEIRKSETATSDNFTVVSLLIS